MDAPAWFALALTLTLLCAAMAVVRFRGGRLASGTRWVGFALLPFGLLLTGILRLASRIVAAFGEWANRLVWSPSTWTGLILLGLGLATVLLAARLPQRTRSAGSPADRSVRPDAGRSRRIGSGTDTVHRGSGGGTREDDDIEAILRRHGIE